MRGLTLLELLVLGLTPCMGISWIVFARMSMPRIEKKVREEGNDRTGWDGLGVRAIWYAGAIVLPIGRANRPNNPLIDPVAVKRHATSTDRKRALCLLVFSNAWLAAVLLMSYLYKH